MARAGLSIFTRKYLIPKGIARIYSLLYFSMLKQIATSMLEYNTLRKPVHNNTAAVLEHLFETPSSKLLSIWHVLAGLSINPKLFLTLSICSWDDMRSKVLTVSPSGR